MKTHVGGVSRYTSGFEIAKKSPYYDKCRKDRLIKESKDYLPIWTIRVGADRRFNFLEEKIGGKKKGRTQINWTSARINMLQEMRSMKTRLVELEKGDALEPKSRLRIGEMDRIYQEFKKDYRLNEKKEHKNLVGIGQVVHPSQLRIKSATKFSIFRATTNSKAKRPNEIEVKGGLRKKWIEYGEPKEKYFILKKLGSGSFGTVYLVKNSKGKKFALKILDKSNNACTVKRIVNEFNIIRGLNHPNIIKVYDIGETIPKGKMGKDQGFLIIRFEYFEGESLDKAIPKNGLSRKLGNQVKNQVLEALKYGHQNGLYHLDIKPANILYHCDKKTGKVTIKIVDYGLSIRLPGKGRSGIRENQVGWAFGTPQYMSRRVAKGGRLVASKRSVYKFGLAQADAFSFALTMFKVLTGLVPGGGEKKPIKYYGTFPVSVHIKAAKKYLKDDPVNRDFIVRLLNCYKTNLALADLTEIDRLSEFKVSKTRRYKGYPPAVLFGRYMDGEYYVKAPVLKQLNKLSKGSKNVKFSVQKRQGFIDEMKSLLNEIKMLFKKGQMTFDNDSRKALNGFAKDYNYYKDNQARKKRAYIMSQKNKLETQITKFKKYKGINFEQFSKKVFFGWNRNTEEYFVHKHTISKLKYLSRQLEELEDVIFWNKSKVKYLTKMENLLDAIYENFPDFLDSDSNADLNEMKDLYDVHFSRLEYLLKKERKK